MSSEQFRGLFGTGAQSLTKQVVRDTAGVSFIFTGGSTLDGIGQPPLFSGPLTAHCLLLTALELADLGLVLERQTDVIQPFQEGFSAEGIDVELQGQGEVI